MDTEHLRTFLEVARTRHFGKAAENLFVTQSAVSARIRMLETTLGTELFVRKRNDVQLTGAGERLVNHAATIVAAWTRARQEAGLDPDQGELLAIGAVFDLWPVLLDNWLGQLAGKLSGVVISAEANASDALLRRLVDGLLDLAMLFEAPAMPELVSRQIAELDLVMVATRPRLKAAQAIATGYILVDWGLSLAQEHARHFPDLPSVALRAGQGSIACAWLRQRQGAAYLPRALVRGDMKSGRLHRVTDAPVFRRPVYALYRRGTARESTIQAALALFKRKRA